METEALSKAQTDYHKRACIGRIDDALLRIDAMLGIGKKPHLSNITSEDALIAAGLAGIKKGEVVFNRYGDWDAGSVTITEGMRSVRIYFNGSNVVVKQGGVEVREHCHKIQSVLKLKYQW